jgi:hypothetical protein
VVVVVVVVVVIPTILAAATTLLMITGPVNGTLIHPTLVHAPIPLNTLNTGTRPVYAIVTSLIHTTYAVKLHSVGWVVVRSLIVMAFHLG